MTLEFEEFEGDTIPEYGILSHRWEDEEILYKDMVKHRAQTKKGYSKILCACELAISKHLQYIWIDTCCIDKKSSAELTEAINSMYAWYRDADECFAYLSDVPDVPLEETVWFTRGWTLQEMVAPAKMSFYDKDWNLIGSKHDLSQKLSDATLVPKDVLEGERNVSDAPVACRISWAAHRQTTRIEDRAYSLLGILGVKMPMLYGEGIAAFRRLQEEFMKISTDTSILLWDAEAETTSEFLDILAPSPSEFRFIAYEYKQLLATNRNTAVDSTSFTMSNAGLSIELQLIPWVLGVYLAPLDCGDVSQTHTKPCIFVTAMYGKSNLARFRYEGKDHINIKISYSADPFLVTTANIMQPNVFSQPLHYGSHAADHAHIVIKRQVMLLKSENITDSVEWQRRPRRHRWLQPKIHGLVVICKAKGLWSAEGIVSSEAVQGFGVQCQCTASATRIEFLSPPGVSFIIGSIQTEVEAKDGKVAIYFAIDENFEPVCLISSSPRLRRKCSSLTETTCYLWEIINQPGTEVHRGFSPFQISASTGLVIEIWEHSVSSEGSITIKLS